MKHLRTYEFKPFVIFIKPPSLDRLRETRKNAKIISSKDDKGTAKPFTVSIIRHGKAWELVKCFVVEVYLENKGDHWISLTALVRACTSIFLFPSFSHITHLQFPWSSDFMSLKNPHRASISLWEIMLWISFKNLHLGLEVSVQIQEFICFINVLRGLNLEENSDIKKQLKK